ncbi:hypothetical protein Q4543_04710 [Salipiger sp. 1_MG-2023]|uniref:hypothetical protein n=1 Tax=Salipiger sp. 1_MG-2023 TaxID=3062665 RepID=UPI0026E2E94B|nr:hypothetical protein [Salipiger sp. 1_MG-2023]MDO6584813.1 hypothetical protein [Salipiger sp. 1_MG-2023]
MDDDVAARFDRIEAMLERMTEGHPDFLTPALRRAMRTEWVTAGELWALAQALDMAAEAEGNPRPELPEALQLAGLLSSHGLGRWLAKREGQGFIRGAATNGGTLWHVE